MNLNAKSKRTTKSSPTPVEKKPRLSKKNQKPQKKQGSSKTIDSPETSKKTSEQTCFDKRRSTIQTCFENQTIDTIYEDTVSNDSESDISSNQINYCLICGDNTELSEHIVCFWHALTEKNSLNLPLYTNECEYSLRKYGQGRSYLSRVYEKKNNLLNKILN